MTASLSTLPSIIQGGMGVGVSDWRLARAVSQTGELGVVSGTAFAFCEESGLRPEYKATTLTKSRAQQVRVFTDPKASPTGFPFKVLEAAGTLSDPKVYETRTRICDLGYLRTACRRDDGSVGYRCPAEPVEDYLRKGGKLEDTVGRKCVCNGLMGAIGLEQQRDGQSEPTLLTAGVDAARIAEFMPEGKDHYSAADVVRTLLTQK